jgi:DNA-binding transcriptional LysR family regulator
MDRLRRIELLVRAVDAGSFAKAARSLELTPSAVSHAIAQLEKELRVPLFYRTTRQLRLTEDGEGVYQRGCEILRQLAELESDARKGPDRLTGTLRVGLGVPVSRHVIMPLLPAFLRRHPNLRLQFFVQTQPKEMHAEGVELLIRFGEPPESGLIARKLAHTRHAVYASPKYIELAGAPATPDDLLQHRCLLLKVPFLTKAMDEWEFERSGEHKLIKVIPAVATFDREGLIAAVLAGAGLMKLGCFDPGLVASGQLRKVLTDWSCPGGFPIYALYRKTARMSPKLAAFLGFVAEAFAAFDPEEITLLHDSGLADSLRRRRDQARA